MEGTCQNCDREDPDLVLVHRVYVMPESRVEETEWWCFSCRSVYPHEEAEGNVTPPPHA